MSEQKPYIVSRASDALGDSPPCEGAYKATFIGGGSAWMIEIPNLLEFVEEYGRCVIHKKDRGYTRIQIYDDWIE